MTNHGSRFIRNPKECTIASRRSCCAHFRSRATNFSQEFVSSFELAYVTMAFKGTIRLTARSFLRGEVEEPSPRAFGWESVIHDARVIKPGVYPHKNIRSVRRKNAPGVNGVLFSITCRAVCGTLFGINSADALKMPGASPARVVIY